MEKSFKTLIKKTWKMISINVMFLDEQVDIMTVAILPKLIYNLTVFSIKITDGFFSLGTQ